ncbi:MAG: M24 family metallopeptidase [Ktedonobacterales bacterium]
MDLEAIQNAVNEEDIDGWLFFDFRRSNPIAHAVLGLPRQGLFSRRWLYYVPRIGDPVAITSAVESHVLAGLPGQQLVYRTWQEYRDQLAHLLKGSRRVAMEYSPQNAIPYVSRVDAGTVEMVRMLGPEVVSSGDMAQRFEATLTPYQIESHRRAGHALQHVFQEICAWLRRQLLTGVTLTEYDTQCEVVQRMTEEHLLVDESDLPLVAASGNASNPHYSPSLARSSLIRLGDLLLLDFSAPLAEDGAIFADYTWMVYLGAEVPERIARLFGIICSARNAGVAFLQERFAANLRTEGWEVDDAVRRVIADAGFGDYFVHRTGHSIGGPMVHGNGANFDNLETHDTRQVLLNTCASIEPGIYIPEESIGLRSEVDVLALRDGIEVTGLPAQVEVLPLLA